MESCVTERAKLAIWYDGVVYDSKTWDLTDRRLDGNLLYSCIQWNNFIWRQHHSIRVSKLRQTKNINHRLTNINHRLTNINHLLTNINHRLTNINHRLTNINHQLTNINHRRTKHINLRVIKFSVKRGILKNCYGAILEMINLWYQIHHRQFKNISIDAIRAQEPTSRSTLPLLVRRTMLQTVYPILRQRSKQRIPKIMRSSQQIIRRVHRLPPMILHAEGNDIVQGALGLFLGFLLLRFLRRGLLVVLGSSVGFGAVSPVSTILRMRDFGVVVATGGVIAPPMIPLISFHRPSEMGVMFVVGAAVVVLGLEVVVALATSPRMSFSKFSEIGVTLVVVDTVVFRVSFGGLGADVAVGSGSFVVVVHMGKIGVSVVVVVGWGAGVVGWGAGVVVVVVVVTSNGSPKSRATKLLISSGLCFTPAFFTVFEGVSMRLKDCRPRSLVLLRDFLGTGAGSGLSWSNRSLPPLVTAKRLVGSGFGIRGVNCLLDVKGRRLTLSNGARDGKGCLDFGLSPKSATNISSRGSIKGSPTLAIGCRMRSCLLKPLLLAMNPWIWFWKGACKGFWKLLTNGLRDCRELAGKPNVFGAELI
ncbi:unnamed protein product [Cyprideis torosa]|uniref:Uncharacterized protein n=1 Tax=Cyprideis torosa TaxID=163714 RepID=A0A7R8WDR5_9CRUS|nr:unnamed protein product [Cyprideis torosa]CAG0888814.1 unnamed protein product [Cyprideis torosa]